MSSAAIANGGGIAAGSTVAVLQSLGTRVVLTASLGSVGGRAVGLVGYGVWCWWSAAA